MPTGWLYRVLIVVLTIVTLASVAVIVQQDSSPAATPAWCSYPNPGGVAALQAAVDERVADIGRYSPGQPVDRFTLQLDLMTRCAR